MIDIVTGGAGFLGSHFIDYLLRETDKEILGVDNLLTGDLVNLVYALRNRRFEFRECSIEDLKPKSWLDIDTIYNFASPASPVDYRKYPIATLECGSIGIFNLLELCRKHDATLVHASTSEVYGDPLVSPQPETYWGNVNPIGERSMYDESKRFAEATIMAYRDSYGLNTEIVRIFNTYGPRMKVNDGRVVPNLIYQALRNLPMTIYGDGKQTRSFCYYTDMIYGIYRVREKGNNMPYNIGNPNEINMLELAKIIKRLAISDSEIVFKPLPPDDPRTRNPDISRMKELGWKPNISLESGLKETISVYKRDVW